MYVRLLLFVTLVAAQEPVVVNDIVDSLLDEVSKSLVQTGAQVVDVPDLKKTIVVGILEGGLKASGGVMGDFSSMKRTGDMMLVRQEDGKSAVFTGSLHMDRLHLDYANLGTFLSRISVVDQLTVHVNDNAFKIKVSVVSGEFCAVTVDQVALQRFDGLKAELSKARWLKLGADTIAKWVVSIFRKTIQEVVTAELIKVLDTEFKKYNLCSYFL